jgi:CRP-like cAMP-binding protein
LVDLYRCDRDDGDALLMVSLRRAQFLVENLADRVALTLWEYAGHPEARWARGLLPSVLTHEELAALVGASRPRVSLVLRQLESRGFFVREGNHIRVREKPLRAYLERQYEFLL